MDAEQLKQFLSVHSRGATRNEIRELLKLIARPDIISLAGGLPSPEAFPVKELSELLPRVIQRHSAEALQYGATEGDIGLRQQMIELMIRMDGDQWAGLTTENVLVTSASQQALDLCGRVFLNRGDVVICGLPSYLGALGAFTACGARMSGIPLDEEGIRTDLIEQRLVDLRRAGERVKLIYTVPDFQNPSGVTLSRRRREELLSIAREFDLLVVEDSPYRALRYTGEPQPSMYSLDRDGRVITMFTFSKILFPGLRIGWVVASPEIISHFVVAKQPVDLCTSGLGQVVIREYMKAGLLPTQIERIRRLYSVKRDALLKALERYMDPAWGVSWTRPEGGLFLWVALPRGMDSGKLLEKALDEKIAFVTGRPFHCDGSGRNTLRLNFSFPSVEEIDTAMRRLARAIGSMLKDVEALGGDEEPAEGEPALTATGEHSLEQISWNLALSEVVE